MYSFISTVYHLCIILAVYCSRCLYHYFTVTVTWAYLRDDL